jgi:hypothetical protein
MMNSKTKPYTESVATRLPAGLTSEKDLWTEIYKIVEADLGKKRAFYMMNYSEDFFPDVMHDYKYL